MSFQFGMEVAGIHHAKSIMEVTNDAFMADAFFKREEYHLRFTLDDVHRMMKEENSAFLIAVNKEENENDGIVGSMILHWVTEKVEAQTLKLTGKFSAVSVPSKFGKRGIGKSLVKYAEQFMGNVAEKIIQKSDNLKLTEVNIEMGVINLRTDLFPWYQLQGYDIIGEIRPNDDELLRIVKEGMYVCCILMRKKLR